MLKKSKKGREEGERPTRHFCCHVNARKGRLRVSSKISVKIAFRKSSDRMSGRVSEESPPANHGVSLVLYQSLGSERRGAEERAGKKIERLHPKSWKKQKKANLYY